MTSRLGDLLTQKLSLPKNVQQSVSHSKIDANPAATDDKSEVNQSDDKSTNKSASGGLKTQPTVDTFNDTTQINQLSRDELEKIQNTWDLPKTLKASKEICSEDLQAESKNSGSLLGNSSNEVAVLSTQKNDKNSDSLLGKRKLFQVETVKTDGSLDK